MILWLQFIACSGLILYAGTQLTRYGDVIAEKTRLGRTWIGVILLASVTSLPELMTGVSSVALYELPDIAVGNVIGACMLNLFMISCLDLVDGATPLSAKVHQGQVLTAAFGVLMLGIAAMAILLGPSLPAFGWLGSYSVVLVALYLVAMKTVFLYEKKRLSEFVKELAEEARYEKIPTRSAYLRFGAHALLIVAAAAYLPGLADGIAEQTGLGDTFVGSVLVAAATTLPELTVSFSAVRIGAVDMAVGNLFGSNLFNLLVLGVDDLVYSRGPLLTFVSAEHLITSVAAIAMTAVAIIGLTYRAGKKTLFLAWDATGIFALYIATMAVLYGRR